MAPLLRRTGTDDRAFEKLYQRHVRDVFRYSLAVLGEPADAEDVTQTTFMNAYRAFKRGERPEKPENWLIAIAHNVCRQRFRQAQRRPHEVEYADEVAPALEESDGPSAEDLRRAFSHLPPNQRAALVMRELEGRSYAEIAAVLEINVSALETLLFRARRALREQLEEQLTCREAELAISRQMDGRLSNGERGMLRAHLRACPECARLAQSQRAQRKVLRSLLAVPLPPGLTSFLHPGSEAVATAATTAAAATGTGVAVKAAAVVAGAAIVGGGTYAGVEKVPAIVKRAHPQRIAAKPAPPAATTRVAAAAPVVALPAATTAEVAGRGIRKDDSGLHRDRSGSDVGLHRGDSKGDVDVHLRHRGRDGDVHLRHGKQKSRPDRGENRGRSDAAKAAAPGQTRSARRHETKRAEPGHHRAEKRGGNAAKADDRRERKRAQEQRKAERRTSHGQPAAKAKHERGRAAEQQPPAESAADGGRKGGGPPDDLSGGKGQDAHGRR